jgi:hypothetical protein
VSAVAFQAIEFMIGQRESRTGITRLNQGLDADAMNKTATGTALLQAQGQQIEEYLARNFAEAVARLMRLKLRLMSRYGQPMKLRVDGEYREIDPRQWPEDMQVMIRVGLGFGPQGSAAAEPHDAASDPARGDAQRTAHRQPGKPLQVDRWAW